jgi:hypothetical protein
MRSLRRSTLHTLHGGPYAGLDVIERTALCAATLHKIGSGRDRLVRTIDVLGKNISRPVPEASRRQMRQLPTTAPETWVHPKLPRCP